MQRDGHQRLPGVLNGAGLLRCALCEVKRIHTIATVCKEFRNSHRRKRGIEAMARRTKEDAAITREQLLDAAETVFRRRGIARSSLAEVAAAAGVTRGAVYWHFRDKADLCAAMCERALLPMEMMLSDAGAATHDDPLGTLRTLAITALTRLASDP